MIDRKLNYGRHNIKQFMEKSCPFHKVLDIGAGSGYDLDLARAVNPSAKFLAVEQLEQNITGLRNRNIEAYQRDIEKDELPFECGTIDLVVANQILEHTKEIFWIFHEISRVLKVGGNIILGVPNLASFHNRILLLAGRQPTPIQLHSAHIRGFTKPGLLNFLNIYKGYRLVDFKGSNFYPFPPFLAKPLARMFPSSAWGIFFLFHKTKEYSNEFLEFLNIQQLETKYYHGRPA